MQAEYAPIVRRLYAEVRQEGDPSLIWNGELYSKGISVTEKLVSP